MDDDLDVSDYEQLGIDDGTFDNVNHMSYQTSYGASVDLDELTDEQRDAYDLGYNSGAEDFDLYEDDEEEDW